jgi:hypothetical protein
MGILDVFKIGGLKRRANRGGTVATPTYNPAREATQVLALPNYYEHLADLTTSRLRQDSRATLRELFHNDPDVSAAVFAYLTVSNTDPIFTVRDELGQLSRDGFNMLQLIIRRVFGLGDYTQGFRLREGMKQICANMRYLLLLRGAIGAELVYDRTYAPDELRLVDMNTIRWYEPKAGQYKPRQVTDGQLNGIDLDIPNFFVSFFRRDPTNIYTNSCFVSAINTIAARQQIINDMYRLMYITGYPRMDITVLEQVMRNAAPADAQTDPVKMQAWIDTQLGAIRTAVADLRPDQALVHSDSVTARIINDKNPGSAVDISKVIDILNDQNQSALKVMSTIIGRGDSGVNTASVEARIFSMSADELNVPVAELLSNAMTFALRMQGLPVTVEVEFRNAEMRPDMELEPQWTLKQDRLSRALSIGVISDDEFHLQMYGRHRPEWAPILSGTGFYDGPDTAFDKLGSMSTQSDPLGRQLTPDGSQAAQSNSVK